LTLAESQEGERGWYWQRINNAPTVPVTKNCMQQSTY